MNALFALYYLLVLLQAFALAANVNIDLNIRNSYCLHFEDWIRLLLLLDSNLLYFIEYDILMETGLIY